MIDLHFLRYRAKQEIGNFRSFLALQPLKNPKNQNSERWKNLLEISSFNTCAPKITIIWCIVPEIQSETQNFLSFWAIFCPFTSPPPPPPTCPPPPNDLKYQDFEKKKKMKKMPGDIIILYIHVYHKWRSYDIWFLKYKMRQTNIFDIFVHFLFFQSLDNLENQNFNIEKNTWRYCHFTHLHHKWQSYDI